MTEFTSITIAEVLQGVRDERAASAVESVLDEFELIAVPEPRTAIEAARTTAGSAPAEQQSGTRSTS